MNLFSLKHFLTFITAFIVIILNFTAHADCTPNTIGKIENYLNNLDKVALPFSQIDQNKSTVKGILLIEKPYFFRVNYDDSNPLTIVGGKNFISVYDHELEELSRINAKDNLFKFLLGNNINLSKTIFIDTCHQDNNIINIEVSHRETGQKALIRFAESSDLTLKQLIIPNDGQDIHKGAILIDFLPKVTALSIPKELFIMKDPNVYGPIKRYKNADILRIIQ